ncbi:MAG: hypothetical protein SOI13_01700 [Bifidobacterium mongoliense]|jgi:hypothetical protein|uniref:hypothetical protein n=1 Tax=Bifidobacterium mongoliense TaxID=518643 RepID=UPI002F3593DF
MLDTDVLHHDLTAFDAACHRLYTDGLLSEPTLIELHAIVHREAWEMMEIKGLDR